MEYKIHHDANFVITGDTEVVIMTTSAATSDDKIGIMITLNFQYSVLYEYEMLYSSCANLTVTFSLPQRR